MAMWVDRVVPDKGSIAGGHLITIYGRGLLPEAPDPLVPATVVTIGGTICDIQKVMSTSRKLVCKTRAYSGAALAKLDGVATLFTGRDRGCSGELPVSVVTNGVGGDIRASWNNPRSRCRRGGRRECSYTYLWQSTPSLLSVSPRAVAPGSLITVSGRTGIADLYSEDGQIMEAGLKRFERVNVGGVPCELSLPTCDVTSTRQCPTMYPANLTRRAARRPGWAADDGVFQCRLPTTLPLGRHNVSFSLPSQYGASVLLGAAMSPGVLPNESSAVFEAIPLLESVRYHPSDGDLLELTSAGMASRTPNGSYAPVDVTVGGIACPEVPALRTARSVVCNRTHGLSEHQAASSYYASCAELLAAAPETISGLYEVQPPGAPVLTVWCDMDTAGGGWTLCGKYDAANAANETHLAPGVGTDAFTAGGWDAAAAVASVTGPIPAGSPIDALFDTSASCDAGASPPSSIGALFERRPAASQGLTREWWAWTTYGFNLTTGSRQGAEGARPWIYEAGCTHGSTCAQSVIDSGVPPNGTDVLAGPGIQFPPLWNGYRSYAVQLRGYFVPPFTAEYRFAPWSDNDEHVKVYLSTDSDPAHEVEIAQHTQGRPIFMQGFRGAGNAGPTYTPLEAGRAYYIRITHAMHNTYEQGRAGKMRLKLCIIPPAGSNYTLPPDAGGANSWWEDRTGSESGYGGGMEPKLWDLTCAPGWGEGISGWSWNKSQVLYHSASWTGSHAIQPAPPSFFRPLNSTLSAFERGLTNETSASASASAASAPPTSVWSAAQGAARAFSDGATSCATVSGASVFWGVGASADFGAACASGTYPLVGTPCSASALPAKRFNLLLVRSGAAEQASRRGLAQRRFRFEYPIDGSDSTVEQFMTDAGLPPRSPFYSRSFLKDDQVLAGSPISANAFLYSALPTPVLEMAIPSEWMGMRRWLQVSNGYFTPPVSSYYMFAPWHDAGNKGGTYLTLSNSADPSVSPIIAYTWNWQSMRPSRWLKLEGGKLYYLEWWSLYVGPPGWSGRAPASVSVRIATTAPDGTAVSLPADLAALATTESETATCRASYSEVCYGTTPPDGCFNGCKTLDPKKWTPFDALNPCTNENNAIDQPDRCTEMDHTFRESFLLDPIPQQMLRHSGPAPPPTVYHAGNRGARREWWGWTDCFNPETSRLYLDEAWAFPFANVEGKSAPYLLNASIPPNITEIVTELASPPTPVHGAVCFVQTLTAFFKPKRNASYEFKLWSHDYKYARLFFNPAGTDPDGAVEIAAARDNRYPDQRGPRVDDNKNRAARATSAPLQLEAGSLYFMKIYQASSSHWARGAGRMHVTMKVSIDGGERPPHRPAKYVPDDPCTPVDDPAGDDAPIGFELVDDTWLVAALDEPQVVLRTADGVVARCDDGMSGCAVPAGPPPSARRRRLAEGAEEESSSTVDRERTTMMARGGDDDERGGAGPLKMKPTAADDKARTPPTSFLDDDGESDDRVNYHPEAPLIEDVEGLLARAPLLGGAPRPLGELKSAWAAAAQSTSSSSSSDLLRHAGVGRRLSSSAAAALRWSDSAGTWGGEPPNASTPIVFIPNGTEILLDVPFASIRIWVIEGILTLADELDIEIGAEAIIINHGELRVGSAASPFSHTAQFTLRGHWQTPQLPVFGIKTIALTQGTLQLHGQPKTSFERLATTASAGTSALTLVAAPSGWGVGDAVVITSNVPELGCTLTRDDACQSEEHTIAAISGEVVTLASPLAYDHVAESLTADGKSVLLTVEVVNLNRNVKIVGSGGSGTAGFGGHVMLLAPTDGASSIHHVELFRMGQQFRVGRYPIHLHAVTDEGGVGDVSRTTIVGVSVHHSFNRGINIHGGSGATVNASTIYKNLGHAFFVEDGSEFGNTFAGNLGALTLRAMSLLESDQTPSTYWITNPDNNFIDNVAAGGDGFGFWINLPRHPGGFLNFRGASFRDSIFPQHALPGSFRNNVAHGYLTGFLAHDLDPKVFDPRRQTKWKRDLVSRVRYKEVDDDPGMRRPARFEGLLTYSNRDSGAILQHMGHLIISGFVSAKQPVGLEALGYVAEQWGSDDNSWNAPLITDSLFVGGADAECGIFGPMSDWLTISNTAFDTFPSRGAAGICACRSCIGGKGGQEMRTKQLRFTNVRARAHFGHHFVGMINDLDGSLTGVAGGWMHGRSIEEASPLGHFPSDHCATSALGATTLAPNNFVEAAIVCDSSVSLRTFRWRVTKPAATFASRAAMVSTSFGQAIVPFYQYDILWRTANNHFTYVVGKSGSVGDMPHTIDFRPLMEYPIDHLGWGHGEMCGLRSSESALLELPTLGDPNRWGVEGNELPYPVDTVGPLSALAEARRVNGFWSYTPASINTTSGARLADGLLQMMVAPRTGGASFGDGTSEKPACSSSKPRDCHEGQRCVNAKLERFECAPVGCFVDSDTCLGDNRASPGAAAGATNKTHDWCVPDGDGWSVPTAGANVTIPPGVTVTLTNCTTAVVHRLDVFGTLLFVDGTDSTLNAVYIHVAAVTGRLEAGTHAQPFTSAASIQLHGTRETPPYPNSGLGSKFLVAFGELSLVGAPLGAGVSLWDRVQLTAGSGEGVVTLESSWVNAVGLSAGDQLLLAPSGLAWNESEIVTIDFCCNASETLGSSYVEATLSAPLLYDHRGVANTSVLGASYPFMAAEVGLVSTADKRFLNVAVQGMGDAADGFGAVVYVMQKTSMCPSAAGGAPPAGSANVSGVAFTHCGQRGWADRGCINVRPQQARADAWATGGAVAIDSTVILDGFNSGILIDRAHDTRIDGNVIARTLSYGVKVHGQRNRVTNNLISEIGDAYDANNGVATVSWNYRWKGGTIEAAGIHHQGRGGLVSGNSVAGAEAMAIMTDGHECGATETITSNTAHSALVGLFYAQRQSEHAGTPDDGALGVSSRDGYAVNPQTVVTCYELSFMNIHSTLLYGAHTGRLLNPATRGATSSLAYKNFTLIDTGIALSHASEGPDSTHHDKSRPDIHWKVSGATVLAGPSRCRQMGLVRANFHNVGLPWGPHGINMHAIRQAPSLYGGTVLQDSFFDGFGVADGSYEYNELYRVTCTAGARNYAISSDYPTKKRTVEGESGGDGGANLNQDASNPLTVSGLAFGSSVDAASRYLLQPADPSYIGDQGCAQIDCDGRRNFFIFDLDGSLIGAPGTAIPLNEVRFNESLTYVDSTGAATPEDLIPSAMSVGADGAALPSDQIYDAAGISRHPSAGTCSWSAAAGAYECIGGLHRQIIVEDITHTTLESRIAPVAMLVDGHLSLATGPQNYAVSYVAATERLNTFWLTGVVGRTHDIHFSSTVPRKLRLHLRDVTPSQWVLARVHYGGVPNRVDAFVGGARVAAASSAAGVDASSADHGTSFHDVDTTSILVLLKGSAPVDLLLSTCVTLGLGLAVSESEFFATGRDGLVANIATLLGIPQSRIKVPGTAAASGRRRLSSSGGDGASGSGTNSSSNAQITLVLEGDAPSEIATSDVASVSTDLEQDLALQSFTIEMQGLQANLTSAAETGMLAQIVSNVTGSPPTSMNVSAVTASVPGWNGEPSDYDASNGCDCGYGLQDPDCIAAPTPVSGCAPLVDVATGSAQIAAAVVVEDDEEEDVVEEEDDLDDEGLEGIGNVTVAAEVDLSILTPTRMCTAATSMLNLSTGMTSATLGVCDYALPHWSGSGSDFNAGDGVCHCGRGLWDPDCDAIDFTNPELNASSFGCPSDGERYLCYRETRSCFADLSGGLAQGVSGKTIVPEVSFAAVVTGTVDTFDDDGYKSSLGALLGVDAAEISLVVTSASVRVVATVRATNPQAAQGIANVLGDLNSTAASAALGVSVQTLEAPVVALVTRDAPSPPPFPAPPSLAEDPTPPPSQIDAAAPSPPPAGLASPPPSTAQADGLPQSIMVIGIIAGVVLVGLVLVVVAIFRPPCCFPRRISRVPKQQQATRVAKV